MSGGVAPPSPTEPASAAIDEAPTGSVRLDSFAAYVAELLEWLAGSLSGPNRAGQDDGEIAAADPSEMTDDGRDLLAFLDAHWQPVVVPRRGGHKRKRPTRLMNPDGSISVLANAWAADAGQPRAWGRSCLAALVRSGAIAHEPMGSGYAWRLRRTTHGTSCGAGRPHTRRPPQSRDPS